MSTEVMKNSPDAPDATVPPATKFDAVLETVYAYGDPAGRMILFARDGKVFHVERVFFDTDILISAGDYSIENDAVDVHDGVYSVKGGGRVRFTTGGDSPLSITTRTITLKEDTKMVVVSEDLEIKI